LSNALLLLGRIILSFALGLDCFNRKGREEDLVESLLGSAIAQMIARFRFAAFGLLSQLTNNLFWVILFSSSTRKFSCGGCDKCDSKG
jgi:hypothetical protein